VLTEQLSEIEEMMKRPTPRSMQLQTFHVMAPDLQIGTFYCSNGFVGCKCWFGKDIRKRARAKATPHIVCGEYISDKKKEYQ